MYRGRTGPKPLPQIKSYRTLRDGNLAQRQSGACLACLCIDRELGLCPWHHLSTTLGVHVCLQPRVLCRQAYSYHRPRPDSDLCLKHLLNVCTQRAPVISILQGLSCGTWPGEVRALVAASSETPNTRTTLVHPEVWGALDPIRHHT